MLDTLKTRLDESIAQGVPVDNPDPEQAISSEVYVLTVTLRRIYVCSLYDRGLGLGLLACLLIKGWCKGWFGAVAG